MGDFCESFRENFVRALLRATGVRNYEAPPSVVEESFAWRSNTGLAVDSNLLKLIIYVNVIRDTYDLRSLSR